MDFKKELWMKRYEVTIKITESCRAREFFMINASMIIYGASVAFIYPIINSYFKCFSVLFTAVIVALVGLYISKLNAVEQMHHLIEKNIYIRAGITTYDGIQYKHKKGFNKNVLTSIYVFMLFSLLAWALSILYKLKLPVCGLILCGIIGLIMLLWYCFYFQSIMFLSEKVEDEIVGVDKNIRIE